MRALGDAEARKLGQYRLLVELRADDLGRVLLGTGTEGQLVALTLIDEHLVNDLFRARLRTEIENAAPAAHIVHVVDGDAAAAQPWVATGFIPRATLRAALDRTGPLPTSSLLRLADGLAEALGELHDQGFVHGGLTPDTVLLTDIGPLLVDSAVARATGENTPADDLRALGTVLAAAGGPDVAEPVREIIALCAAGELSPAALRSVIGPLPLSGRPWPPAVRDLAFEESDRVVELIVEHGWTPTTPLVTGPEPVAPAPPPRPLTRFVDGVVVTVVAGFVGFLFSWWVFGDAKLVPLPDHATIVAQSSGFTAGAVRVTWPFTGVAFAIVCTWLVLLIARTRTNRVPWLVLTGLSVLPVVLWLLTFAGLDVRLVAAPTMPGLHTGAFIPAFIAMGVGASVASRLFRDGRRGAAGVVITMSLVTVGVTVTTGLYFGWYGVVVERTVPLDAAGVPAGCLAGSIAARAFRFAQ